MAYDPAAESLRLFDEGLPEPLPSRLSRRRRFSPLSYDIAGNVAGTLFVRRGVSGEPWIEAWLFERADGRWKMLGGGGGNAGGNPLELRPPASDLGAHLLGGGSGWSRRPSVRWYSLRARGVSRAELVVSAEVVRLRVERREIVIPPHGRQIVVWARRRAPRVQACAVDGRVVQEIDLRDPLSVPGSPMGRFRRRVRRRFGRPA